MIDNWTAPAITENIPKGDMPGDKISFSKNSIRRANKIFPYVYREIENILKNNDKCVISLCGGSGVGKTTIASLITYYLNDLKIGAYTLSGDNYPKRIPEENDAERERLYNEGGEEALYNYLGSPSEIEYDLINEVIAKFKSDESVISLRRMGRKKDEIWFEDKDFSNIKVLVIEWTHGNSEFLKGIDLPVYLKSTPKETLASRKARNRNKNTDTPFINMVLEMEQKKLDKNAYKAKIVLNRDDRITSPMLNAYPDSMGGKLSDIADILECDELKNAFSDFYILPSMFHSDLDRGFCIIDYDLEEKLASLKDIERLKELGINLKLDFVCNHLSVASPQFKDIIEKGKASSYTDFFIDWNKFWEGKGEKNPEGYIEPDKKYIEKMFFRKPGLPVFKLEDEKGETLFFWNTFYNKKKELENGTIKYYGQMDLNIKNPMVQEYYKATINKLAEYGAKTVRLDAFAYASKECGAKNFLNEPGTWDLLDQITSYAAEYNIKLLPEIHASYEEKIYEKISDKGYMTYDFFLPGLILDAFEQKSGEAIARWGKELVDKNIKTVNMLGCHDGIPVLDLKGIIPDERIESLIKAIVDRGGLIKNLHGKKNMYYQVNATYYSALGESDARMLIARAIQMFMPGKPQVWYLDLLGGTNDYEAVRKAGADGHKEINRTNFTLEEIKKRMETPLFKKQVELLRLKNNSLVFASDAEINFTARGSILEIEWKCPAEKLKLEVDFEKEEFKINS